MLIEVVLFFAGIYHAYGTVQNNAEMCSVMKPDTREEPGKMNSDPGTSMNLFPDIKVPMSGRLKSIKFYSVREGNAFLSFWKDRGSRRFTLMQKVQVFSNEGNVLQRHVPSDIIHMEQGDVLAVHYNTNYKGMGIIAYESEETQSLKDQRTPNVTTLYRVYVSNKKDNNWSKGRNLRFTNQALKPYKKSVAVHIEVCDCKDGHFGTYCSGECNCRDGALCDKINGHCETGCKDGFYDTANCSIACMGGTFGSNCSQVCSENCLDLCNAATGVCKNGCRPGYDFNASAICDTVCTFQKHGADCASKCRCKGNTTCNPISGVCASGCADGWEGSDCSTETEPLKDARKEKSSNEPLIIGGICGAFFVILVVVLCTGFFVWKRFKKKRSETCSSAIQEVATKDSENLSSAEEGGNLYMNAPELTARPDYSREIPTKLLHEALKTTNIKQLEVEYKKIPPSSSTRVCTFAMQAELVSKNKFKNIHPYDDNRVVLERLRDDPLTEYINASLIRGYKEQHQPMYIACQGPQQTTIDDFWRMIWQYKVYVIVMLTNLIEDMKIKCEQYWPSEGYVNLGGVRISVEKEEKVGDIVIRHLKVTKKTETRWIKQFQYVDWPDHGTPRTTRTIIKLRSEVRKCHIKYLGTPIVVHCSAGVGRTGTFIALDYLLEQEQEIKSVDVLKCVHTLRKARGLMVQTLAQYIFIYTTLDEHLTLGATSINVTEASEILKERLESEVGKERIKKEYEFLEGTKPQFTKEELKTALANEDKNRDQNVLPTDHNRVQLESTDGEGGEYINALQVEGFRDEGGYIVTQVPLQNTQIEFWRLLLENHVQNIVYLQESGKIDANEIPPWLPNEGKPLELGTISVICKERKDVEELQVINMEIFYVGPCQEGDLYTNVPEQQAVYENVDEMVTETMSIKCVTCSGLSDTKDNDVVMSKIHVLQNVVAEHAIPGQALGVVCQNGAKISGIYLACDILTNMFSNEPAIDVFNAVQRIRFKRPQFIGSIVQYELLYKFALEVAKKKTEESTTKEEQEEESE